jgi:hypothetical protein
MRIPQIADRVKEAPTQAARAVFGGIGQLLLVADRIKSRAAEPDLMEPDSGPRQARAGRPGPVPAAPDETRWRSLDKTGNVRLLGAEDQADDETGPAAASVADAVGPAEPEEAEPEPSSPVGEPESLASEAEPEAKDDDLALPLPLPNYDDLSLPSLRARLRNLGRDQLRVLIAYEQANAGREAVLIMFERRIAKLDQAGRTPLAERHPQQSRTP